jgi:hypothetical protein
VKKIPLPQLKWLGLNNNVLKSKAVKTLLKAKLHKVQFLSLEGITFTTKES